MRQYRNIRQEKAIEAKNRKRWLEVNSNLTDASGIYILTRTDENGFKFSYVGQAVHILQRLCSHLTGYQHIDLSLKSHGLYNKEENPYGWKVWFSEYRKDQLDEMEQYWIKRCADNGFQLRNKTSGSQGEGKAKIDDFRPSKGYHDGLKQGYKNAMKYINNLLDKHLEVRLKPEKQNNKVSIRQYEKFMEELKGEENENSDKETV